MDEDIQQRLAGLLDMLCITDDLSSQDARSSLPWLRIQKGFIASSGYILWKRIATCVLDRPVE